MNETLSTIKNRYSCRSFTGEPIKDDDAKAIALAAVQSPSGMNGQPWQITVLRDKAVIDEMDALGMKLIEEQDKAAYERMMGRGGKLFYNAPCMFLVAKKPGSDLDCGIATENIALAASALGLGNVICGMANSPISSERGKKFKEMLIPEGYEFGMSVLVGYATNDGTPHEPDMSKIKYIG